MREIVKSARISALPAIMAIALSALTLPSAAQAPSVVPACTITEGAVEACEASGGKMDTLKCICVTPPLKTPTPCAIVCPDGRIDTEHCRCIKD